MDLISPSAYVLDGTGSRAYLCPIVWDSDSIGR